MNTRIRGFSLAAALAASLLASSPAEAAPRRVYVRIQPPVLVEEVRPAAPSPRHVWVGGYHRWDGRTYVWTPGTWSVPPRHRGAWVAGRWVRGGHRGWYWVPGHWRR